MAGPLLEDMRQEAAQRAMAELVEVGRLVADWMLCVGGSVKVMVVVLLFVPLQRLGSGMRSLAPH